MKFKNEMLLAKIIADLKTLLMVAILSAFVGTVIGLGVGYNWGVEDMSAHFYAVLNGRN